MLIPQYLLIAGILVMSFFPKLLIEPVSQAIDPQFRFDAGVAGHVAGNDLWLLESVSGHDVCGDCFRHIVWIVLAGAERGLAAIWCKACRSVPLLYGHLYDTDPACRDRVLGWIYRRTTSLAQGARKLYTGNAQAYNLYILYYFIVLYVAGGGLRFALIN